MQIIAISTPRKKRFRKTLQSLERPVNVVAEWELITQNCQWNKKKKMLNLLEDSCYLRIIKSILKITTDTITANIIIIILNAYTVHLLNNL
jgi:hypothetical protein